ncbi:unnamed protein product [Durusdinium trenchii]|uniref:Uncharacterized protein n=1 Tax=Durusdinium trenchii TaxID=1381693 RepID=A0ABP0NA18_9DINO
MPLRTGGNGKENCPTKMVEPRPKVSAKDLRRPLNERNATGEVASEKSVVEKSALVRRTQKATVTGDSRAQRTPRVDPWQEVRAAQAEAEALEVELQSLAAESESLEAQLASAEAREAEAEQQLTSQSAAMLSECDVTSVSSGEVSVRYTGCGSRIAQFPTREWNLRLNFEGFTWL